MSGHVLRMTAVLLCALATLSAYGGARTTRDAIYKSDLIIVGDVVGGSAVDHVANVDCLMLVRADRILKGDPGLAHSLIEVHWQYQPRQDQPPQVTTRIERPHGMWFLKKGAEGRYEAMWAEVNLQNRGGYYLELPRVEPYGVFAYPADADYEYKLAGELGAALEQIAQKQGSGLDMRSRNAGAPALPQPPPPTEVMQFRSLAFAFRELDATKVLNISWHLANSPLVHLKALGLFAQLKAKSAAALLDLERNLPALMVTDDPLGLSFWATTIDIRADVDAIRSVGRMALGETQLLGFADVAVNQLSHTGNSASVPYLEVMLNHPKPEVRATAAGGICVALKSPELKDVANAELQRICGDSPPLPFVSTRAQVQRPAPVPEGQTVELLKTWLTEHRSQVSAFVTFPRLDMPSWSEVAPEPPREEVEVSMARRLEHLLMMLEGHKQVFAPRGSSAVEHMHNRFVDLGLRGMEPAGEAILDAICGNAAAKRKELDDDYQRIANAARVQGQNVNPAILPERAKQYQRIAAGALSELQSQLSTDAWLQLHEFLKSLPLHEYVPKAPNPFFIETPAGVRIHP